MASQENSLAGPETLLSDLLLHACKLLGGQQTDPSSELPQFAAGADGAAALPAGCPALQMVPQPEFAFLAAMLPDMQ
eukprot:1134502-Pelagomonas_calceolata.AAC.4